MTNHRIKRDSIVQWLSIRNRIKEPVSNPGLMILFINIKKEAETSISLFFQNFSVKRERKRASEAEDVNDEDEEEDSDEEL